VVQRLYLNWPHFSQLEDERSSLTDDNF